MADVWEAVEVEGSYVQPFGHLGGGNGFQVMQVMHADIKAERLKTIDDRYKKKYPLMIFFHGIGERTDNTTAARNNPAQLTRLFNTYPMSSLRTDTSTLYTMLYKLPNIAANQRVIFWAPQAWGGHSFFYTQYHRAMLDKIAAEYSDIVDMNRIYMSGLSFGGGACQIGMLDPGVYNRVAAFAYCCAGYSTYGSVANGNLFPYHQQYSNIIASKRPFWASHSQDDDATNAEPGNSSNRAWETDQLVRAVNLLGPSQTIRYTRFISIPGTSQHNTSWAWFFGPPNWGVNRDMGNGTVVDFGNPNWVNWCLQFSIRPS